MRVLYTALVFALMTGSFTGTAGAQRCEQANPYCDTQSTTISWMEAYDDFGAGRTKGDVTVRFVTNLSLCPQGVYLNPDKPGFNTLARFTLSAFLTGKTVHFQVYNDPNRVWGGGVELCEVDAIIIGW